MGPSRVQSFPDRRAYDGSNSSEADSESSASMGKDWLFVAVLRRCLT